MNQFSECPAKFTHVFILFAFFFLSNIALAKNYFVSPDGLDSGKGSVQEPFKTIQHAAFVMKPGDTCFIMQGIYRETIVPLTGGSEERPVVYTRYGNDRVAVTGTDQVKNWKPYKNGIYKAYMPHKVTQLFVNNRRAWPARYPDYSDAGMYQTSDWAKVHADTMGNVRVQDMNKPPDYWKGGVCRILTGRNWIAHIGKITASEGAVIHSDDPWRHLNPEVYLGDGVGCIYNHLHALDHENEWLWQHDTLYYYPDKGLKLNEASAEARIRMDGFYGRGKSWIVVKNISFVWSSVNFMLARNCVLDSCNILYPEPFFIYRSGWIRDQGGGKTYTIDHWEGRGVSLSGTGNIIRNCYVGFSWGDGISMGGIQNTVENCLVENCNWSATDAGAISATGSGHLITHNTLRNAARSILVHRFCSATDITYNDMYNAGLVCEDLGITYAYHTNGGGSVMAYNWVHDNHARSTASGIYLDNYDTSYVVHHNVVWNCVYAIQTNKPAVHHKIVNNTVWNCKYAQWAWGREGTKVEDQLVANNLSDKLWNVGTIFMHNLTTRKTNFINPEAGDFSLQKNSPAVNFGILIPGITDNFNGPAPDAGAYEYGLTPWKAGSDIKPPGLIK